MAAKARGTEVESVETVVGESLPESVRDETPFLPASQVWDDVRSLDRIESFDLEKNKMELVGVPFVVTKVYFRDGEYRRPGEAFPDDFVSLEVVTAPEEAYDKLVPRNRRRFAEDGVPLESEIGPNELVVINDSSTGIKRQITWYLHSHGYINVDSSIPPDFEVLSGGMGQNPLDGFRSGWEFGAAEAEKGIEIRLLVKKGLRLSRYSNDYAADVTTYYLA